MTNRPISKLPPIQPPYVIRIEGDEDFEYFTEETQREVSLYGWIRQRTLSILPEVNFFFLFNNSTAGISSMILSVVTS